MKNFFKNLIGNYFFNAGGIAIASLIVTPPFEINITTAFLIAIPVTLITTILSK